MAQIIQTVCDICQIEGHTEVADTLQFDKGEVDLCKAHAESITIAHMLHLLRSGEVAARSTAPQAPRQGVGQIVCEVSGCSSTRKFRSMQGLRNHMTRSHPEVPQS